MISVYAPITKSWKEIIKTKDGEKSQIFFEATISGLKADRDEEMMAETAIKGMINKLKTGTVPLFPTDHGRDPNTGLSPTDTV